jgi:hypothetical protein
MEGVPEAAPRRDGRRARHMRRAQGGYHAPCQHSVEGTRFWPQTDVPFPSLLGAHAYRLLMAIRAQQRAGGALSASRAPEYQVGSALRKQSSGTRRSPGFYELRPSGTPGAPMASQRPSVARAAWSCGGNGEVCEHAARASDGLPLTGTAVPERSSRGVPGSAIVRNAPRSRLVVPAQLRTRHSRWGVYPACPNADAVVVPVAVFRERERG